MSEAIQPISYNMPRRPMPRTINYNAVKIDIHNPQVNAQPQEEKREGYMTPPVVYNYPQAPIYDVPKASIYESKATVKAVSVPPPVIVQEPITKVEKEPESVLENKNVTNPINSEKKATVDAQATAEVEKAAEASKAEQVAQAKKVEIKDAQKVQPAIDINEFITALTNSDYHVQAKVMEETVKLIQLAPNMAVDLLDVKVVDTLLSIVNQNTENLQGPSPRQLEIRDRIMKGQSVTEAELAEANQITPMELAEKNKQYSIYTLASLDKLYASEVKKMTGEVPPMTELPGAADIVEQIRNNKNPMIKIAGIKAMNYIKTPEYTDDLKAIYNIATQDSDPLVKQVAIRAMAGLEQAQQSDKAAA